MRLRVLCIVIGVAFVGWIMSATAAAASPARALDMPLVPIGGPGTVELVAYVLHADLSCDESGCSIKVEQTYQLHNQGQEAALQLGLPAAEGLPSYALRIEGGSDLAPGDPHPDSATTWVLRLGRGEQKRIVLTSTHPPQSGSLLSWRCETSRLAPWGIIQGARMEFRFPQPITDDTFLVAEPGNLGIGARGLAYWDYEVLQNPQDMEVSALSPAAWQQLQDLRNGQKHGELALFFEALYQEAQQKGLPLADPYDQIVAEWLAQARSKPNDAEARRNLARLYQARGNEMPSLRLNYLLLAAEQLEILVKQGVSEADVANELVRVYEQASRLASENNDPAGALNYLRKASTVPGTTPFAEQETLAMRLALNLAQDGRVSEALHEVQDILAPDLREALWRYMPPFSAAHAQVITSPHERVAHYHMTLYPPAAEKARGRLQEIALALSAIEGCQVSWEPQSLAPSASSMAEPLTTTFTVSLSYPSLAALAERSQAVADELTPDPDLLSALVVAPWRSAPTTYGLARGLWRDRLSYQEGPSLASLQPAWEEGSDYVRWRLVELRNTTPADERAKIEQELVLIVLEQQTQIWEMIPSSSYAIYYVDYPEYPTYRLNWLLAWGQERMLQADHSFYHWDYILAAAAGALALLILLLALLLRRL